MFYFKVFSAGKSNFYCFVLFYLFLYLFIIRIHFARYLIDYVNRSVSIIVIVITVIIVSSFFNWRYILTCIRWRLTILTIRTIFRIVLCSVISGSSWCGCMAMTVCIIFVMCGWRTFINWFFNICWIRFFHSTSSAVQNRQNFLFCWHHCSR